jgi:hypothetical protein
VRLNRKDSTGYWSYKIEINPFNHCDEVLQSRIIFKNDRPTVALQNSATTASNVAESNQLKVSYCYATKEWRCLYRCEIDSSASNAETSKIGLSLFGLVKNPTEEDWSQVELKLVANELEILSNNKTTTTPPAAREEESRSSGGSGMQFYVKTLTGKTITIDVSLQRERRESRLHPIIVSRSRLRIRSIRSNRRSKTRKGFHPISNG